MLYRLILEDCTTAQSRLVESEQVRVKPGLMRLDFGVLHRQDYHRPESFDPSMLVVHRVLTALFVEAHLLYCLRGGAQVVVSLSKRATA